MIFWPNRRDAMLQALAVAALSGPSHSALAAIAAARGNEIDRVLKARVDAGEIPGVVAMAATQRTILYEGAFGVRCLGTQAKMSDDTVFRIASMVKLLTSAAAMQLVERGKLSLDEPAEEIDPTLASPLVLTAARKKTDHAAQPSDAYIGIQLSAMGRQCHALPEGCPQRQKVAE